MKPSLPQGTRDFSANVVRKRAYILKTIRRVFELYGFEPLETPAMENLETLIGKYGDEGDKLMFKILNNGLENENKHNQAQIDFQKVLAGKALKGITERALRYDLTIPFARYVAMNHNQLTLPFKRYQVQPVWRADRPQKGRYREFYQCDADVVGSTSLLNEVELASIYSQVFTELKVDVEIKINSRKMLAALAEICGGSDKLTAVTIAIDKLHKIGLDKVKEELTGKGLLTQQIETIEKYLNLQGDNSQKLEQAKTLFANNATAAKGMEEIEFITGFNTGNAANLTVDFTLARGLNYYTGIIFEVKATQVQMGSLGGGGRYDDLTGTFGVPGIPGVGISFGIDRIYDVMEELKVFPEDVQSGTEVLFFNLGDEESKRAFTLMQMLRLQNVSCELYPENVKFDKQFKYADKKGIKYVIIIGSKELQEGTCLIKDLTTGRQNSHLQNQISSSLFSQSQ